jgi:hypothetical protein
MTERSEGRAPRRKPHPLPTALAALAVFAVAFEFLAFQLTSGRDPAVGATAVTGTTSTKSRPAKKLIITKVIPAAGATASGSTAGYPSSGAVPAPAPVTSSSS